MMNNFDIFLGELKLALTHIAQEAGDDIKDELLKDGRAFVEKSKQDLLRWSQLVAERKLTRDELEYLLQAKKDLAEMEALKHKGLAQAKIDKLKNAVIGAIVNSTVRALG